MRILKVRSGEEKKLEAYLREQMPELGGGLLHKYLRQNKIKLNGKKQPLSTQLLPGDEVRLYLPDAASKTEAGPAFLQARPGFCAAYEDDAVLIAEKPAGVPVDDEEETADTLLNRALRYLYEKGRYDPATAAFTPCLCHRLDTGTSGLVMLAKTQAAADELEQLIRAHSIRKVYEAVSFGHPSPRAGVLRGYLDKDARQGRVYVKQQEERGALPIETHYRTLVTAGPLALLEVELVTGRTHQIRAHFASIDCPLLGDSKYGNVKANREYRMKYQALCARKLYFPTLSGVCAGLSGRCITAKEPWYAAQMRAGGIECKR